MELKLEKERLEKLTRDQIILERKRLEDETRKKMDQREIEKQEMRAKMEKAEIHSQKRTLKFYGFLPLKNNLALAKSGLNIAFNHYQHTLLKREFRAMFASIQRKRELLGIEADAFRKKSQMKRYVHTLIDRRKHNSKRQNTANFIRKQHFGKQILSDWKERAQIAGMKRWEEEREKNAIADRFAAKSVPRRFVGYWKIFVSNQKEGRWREYRRNRLREAAREVLNQTSIQRANEHIELSLGLDTDLLVLD